MTDECSVPDEKIRDYLLNPHHRDGRSKAKFFCGLGFTRDSFPILSLALKEHFAKAANRKRVSGKFAEKMVLEGPINTPSGMSVNIRSVWSLKDGIFVLATAYPV